MFRKLIGFALAVLLVFGLDEGCEPGVAQANTVHACAENSICLFQAKNYLQEKWQSSFNNVYQHPNNCLNIAPAQWSNGTPVNDNSGSLVVNGDPAVTNVWSHYNIYIFNWVNCNPDGGTDVFPGWGESSLPDLGTTFYVNTHGTEYHTITSIGLIPIP